MVQGWKFFKIIIFNPIQILQLFYLYFGSNSNEVNNTLFDWSEILSSLIPISYKHKSKSCHEQIFFHLSLFLTLSLLILKHVPPLKYYYYYWMNKKQFLICIKILRFFFFYFILIRQLIAHEENEGINKIKWTRKEKNISSAQCQSLIYCGVDGIKFFTFNFFYLSFFISSIFIFLKL